jgi:DNA-directed RNA polymerase specialized sigma24 family protein
MSDDPIEIPLETKAAEISSLGELAAVLDGRDKTTALETLLEGDPLGLSGRVQAWMQARGYVLDRRELRLRCLAAIVEHDGCANSAPTLDLYVERVIESTADALMHEEERLAIDGAMIDEPHEPRYLALAEWLMVRPDGLRRATVAINGLPAVQRQVFHRCWVRGCSTGEVARELGLDLKEVEATFRRAIERVSDATEGRELA